MKKINIISKALKRFFVLFVLGTAVFTLSSVSDNYFEVGKNLEIFATLFKELNVYYVEETNPGDLIKEGIDAMLKSLDPYTTYIPESEIEDYKFMTTGQYGGIGALIHKRDEYVIISEPYEGFPAFKAGLIAGDKILEIDHQNVKGKSTNDISNLLKGQPGTNVNVKIERLGKSEALDVVLTREEVKINGVPFSGMINDNVGYIKLNSFTNTSSQEVMSAFKDLKKNSGLKGVILDLRGNGGGLLRESINIVNAFVEKGIEVVSTRGKIKEWDKVHKTLNEPIDKDIPLVVLIDENSASASEIVSGAIQDLDRGVIIGKRSFGKGLVQQALPLTYNAKLKVTVAKYYIPSGRCIQRIDYSNKDEEGKAHNVPDSLKTTFSTLKYKRPVIDGNGIKPDITIENEFSSEIAQSLYGKHHIFDFATEYRVKIDRIDSPDTYVLTDKEYEDFVKFIEGKDYTYETDSERKIEKFKEAAEQEKYFDRVTAEYEALLKKLEENKEADLFSFKEEIKELLEMEIIGRYYYRKGMIRASLRGDKVIDKAMEILGDSTKYNAILQGTASVDK